MVNHMSISLTAYITACFQTALFCLLGANLGLQILVVSNTYIVSRWQNYDIVEYSYVVCSHFVAVECHMHRTDKRHISSTAGSGGPSHFF